MTLLFGMVSLQDEPVPEGVLRRVEEQCDWPRDRVLTLEAPGAALLALQRDTVPRIGEPRIRRAGDTALLFAGRLDNRRALAARLGLGPEAALADEDLVHAAWRADGCDFCRGLIGDFAIALHEPRGGRLVLARDHFGAMPLYHARVGSFVAFASSIEALRSLSGLDRSWDEHWLAETFSGVKDDVERTAYRVIRAVPPAHALTFSAGGPRARRFWSLPSYDAPLRIEPEEATREFRRLFDQSVDCRLRRAGDVASELSGGLDSTSVSATAASLLERDGARLHAFSHALPDSELARRASVDDERPQIEAVLAMYRSIEHHWVLNTLDSQVAVLARSLVRHGAPPRNDLNAYGEELPDVLRARGIRVLLSGFGGDQLVTYGGGGFLESLVAEGDHEMLRTLMIARRGRIGGMLRAMVYRTWPGALSATSGRTAGKRRRDRPIAGTMRVREAAIVAGPQIAWRLGDSAVGAAARGFEYRYPMLDIRLVEFCHNLPARLKRTPSVRRRMIREGMAGRLPDLVRLRDDKSGSTIPTVHLNQMIHAGELAELIARHRHDPLVTRHARPDAMIEALDGAREGSELAGTGTKKELMMLAFLCLWAERDADRSGSPTRGLESF